jgi:hypothetical protein
LIKVKHLKRKMQSLASSEVVMNVSFTVTTAGWLLHDTSAGGQYAHWLEKSTGVALL